MLPPVFIILGFWPNIKDIQFKKILINTKNIENGTTIKNKNICLKNPEILKKYRKTISCFITDSQYIICFYNYGSSENITKFIILSEKREFNKSNNSINISPL